jgi:hypothetical protein
MGTSLSKQGWKLFYAACRGDGVVYRWAKPEYGAPGFHHSAPLTWICSILSEMTRMREIRVREVLAGMVQEVTKGISIDAR